MLMVARMEFSIQVIYMYKLKYGIARPRYSNRLSIHVRLVFFNIKIFKTFEPVIIKMSNVARSTFNTSVSLIIQGKI